MQSLGCFGLPGPSRLAEFQSPNGEIGNAVLSLSFRMEYRVHLAFFQAHVVFSYFFLPGFKFL